MAGTIAQVPSRSRRWWESRSQAGREGAGLAALALVFALAKVLAIWGVGPQHRGDEKVWPRFGALPLLEAEFWSARRPFTVPLIHKLVGLSEGWVVWVFPSTSAEATRAFPVIASLQLEDYVTAATGPLNRVGNVLVTWVRLAPHAAVIVLLALAAAGFLALRGNGRLLAALAGLFIANTVLQAYVSYHGDSTEIERHGLTGAIFLQLAMLVSILVVIELVQKRRVRQESSAVRLSLRSA